MHKTSALLMFIVLLGGAAGCSVDPSVSELAHVTRTQPAISEAEDLS